MKKIGVLILSALLISINVTSAVSAKTNTIRVSLDNIEDIMLEYSPDMKIADNNLKKAEEDYDNLVDKVKDLEDSQKNLSNKKDDLQIKHDQAVSGGQSQDKINEIKGELDKIKDSIKDNNNNLNDLKDTKDKAKYTLRTSRIQYDQNVKKLVFSTQQEYIDYLDTLSKKELKKDEVNSNQKKIEANKMKYEMGFISKKEYTSNLIDNTDNNNNLEELNKKEETSLKNLHLSLGIPANTEIILNNDINTDLDKISKLKFQDDLDMMLDNNSTIKIKDIELDEAEDADDNDYLIDNAEISLEQEKNKAKLEFEKQYNTLMTSYNTIKNSNVKLNEKQNDFSVMQAKYNYGFVSKNQTDDLERELNTKKSDFVSEKNNLYVNYLRYLQMREGY